MSEPAVTIDVDDTVAVVELHRPPHNYFDLDALTALADACDGVRATGCRAIVLCSEGRSFSAGADLRGDVLDDTDRLYEVAARLAEAPVPTIAAVQGAAVGGGFGLALVADFRVVTPRTRLACNFAKLGFHHGFGISVTLPALVGQQRALEILYTAPDIRGEEAVRLGLADRICEEDELRATALGLAREIASSAPLAVAAIRATMRGDLGDRVRAATRREAEQQRALRDTADFREGVQAVAEGRTPIFVGS